jgi:serine/threonine-protein kinase
MSLTPGSRIGPYEVGAPLGAGGMGEVFSAQDTRLKRAVALKVLLSHAIGDPDRRARFDREAQVLASLNHPNIAQVFGVEDADGAPVIAMEFVEGPTLADRIEEVRVHGGRLPVDEALAFASQICDGLEAAHERGVIHRDLKPANIKVRPDDTIKILDFGLARMSAEGAPLDAANSPTMAGPQTELGVALGTAAYMSPEQARGRNVDKRTDIWAFGCVLYEMLTGQPAFSGESTTDVLAAVIQREPDLDHFPPQTPARIAELLRRCLEKNPKDRLRDIADARFEIEQARRAPTPRPGASAVRLASSAAATVPSPPAPSPLVPLGLIVAGAALGAGLYYAVSALRPATVTPDVPTRALINLPPDTTIALSRGSALALSRDGRKLAFAGRSHDKVQLYLRSLDRFESQVMAGTENAADPFFSPDGQWVGFWADGKIKKVSIEGGAPVTIADVRLSRGEAWGDGNTVVVTTLGTGELSHRWPQLLPGGSSVLFTIWNDIGWEPARLAAQHLDGSGRTIVVEGGGYGRYIRDAASSQGFLIYARAEGLLATRFDESRLAVSGTPVPIVDGVVTNLSGGAHFDVAPSGTLAYIPGINAESDRELAWVTLDGTATRAAAMRSMGRIWSLSPDGTRVAWNNTTGTSREVFVQDLIRGTGTRVTNSGWAFMPIWMPDGGSIIFERGVAGSRLYRRPADGRDAEEVLTPTPATQYPASVSPDGVTLALGQYDPISGADIWTVTLPRPGAAATTLAPPQPFVKTKFTEMGARFSRDGAWIAYQSNESGRFEIYVRSFPDGARTVQLTTDGGITPAWTPSGHELLYRGTDNKLKSLTLDLASGAPTGQPRVLFDAAGYEDTFAIAPDGKRLLMMPLIPNEFSATQIHVVLNFLSELRQRVK